jgi:hypothetical protein
MSMLPVSFGEDRFVNETLNGPHPFVILELNCIAGLGYTVID